MHGQTAVPLVCLKATRNAVARLYVCMSLYFVCECLHTSRLLVTCACTSSYIRMYVFYACLYIRMFACMHECARVFSTISPFFGRPFVLFLYLYYACYVRVVSGVQRFSKHFLQMYSHYGTDRVDEFTSSSHQRSLTASQSAVRSKAADVSIQGGPSLILDSTVFLERTASACSWNSLSSCRAL